MAQPGCSRHAGLAGKVVPAEEAAAHIRHGDTVGMSGFAGAGYPKAVPQALAREIHEAHEAGQSFRVDVWTGASTAPEPDGARAAAEGIELRLPYRSDPVGRQKIAAGLKEYIDVHLSHVAQVAWEGFLGPPDVAVVETDAPDRNTPVAPPDAASPAIAGHIVEFLEHEVARGRVPRELLPLQSGVGNVANAVMAGLGASSFEGLTAYTEVLQDGAPRRVLTAGQAAA
jgi:acyl-CoA hydrolase